MLLKLTWKNNVFPTWANCSQNLPYAFHTFSNLAAARKAAVAAASGNNGSAAAIFDDITASFYMPHSSHYNNDHHHSIHMLPTRPKSSLSKFGNSVPVGHGNGHGKFKSMRSLNGDQT